MSRYRRTAPGLHRHCESCYNRRCRVPLEVSVSCMIINCRSLCGASFHMCKENEHTLLCPNEKVPCFNACYGCPFTMPRSRLAKHLEVCPASVVCCSMEWNRWPIEDIKSPLYSNLMKENHGLQSLDLSMTLRDQKHLCERLKMRSFFPELMEEPKEPIPTEMEDAACWVNGEYAECMGDEALINCPLKAAREEHIDKGSQNFTVDKEKYDQFENMFSMEKMGCLEAQKANSKTREKKDKKALSKGSKNPAVSEQEECPKEPVKDGQRGDPVQPDISKTGLAPWQEGVLERLGQEVNPREYNMYIVHHGRMLLTFGQIEACTPREKDFVYGSLEPIPVQTLRSFNVPTSYKHHRIDLKDSANRALTEHKSMDTSDLGMNEKDIPKMDEMFATLLCSAELEIRGHKISEKVATDGLYIDIATQTYNFDMAPFKYNSTLADITAERDLMLYLQMDTETVTLRHNKNTSAFTFLCGHFFRRDEFASHFKNVHSDIQSCLNGWFEERCPLAYLGCTFIQRRLQPSTHRATVSYNQDLSIFTLSPEIPTSLMNDSQLVPTQHTRVTCEDSLSNLPFEVLRHIARYLDSFSLSQLALVSQLFRDVSATLLQDRGMVGLKWKKKSYSHGRSRWKSSIVWEFSSLFSRVGTWCFADTPPMSEHLKRCPYYQMEPKTKPFALTCVCESKSSQKPENLVTQFKRRR